MSQTQESYFIKFHNTLFELEKQMKPALKTIWLFSTFDEQDPESVRSLSNLTAIAMRLLDPTVKMTLDRDAEDQDNIKYYHRVSIDDFLLNPSNSMTKFQIVYKDVNHTVHIFETTVEGQTLRVVTLPFEKKIINVSEITENIEVIKGMHQQCHKEEKINRLQGVGLRGHQDNWKIQIKEKENEFTEKEDKNHTKIFRIESLIYILNLRSEFSAVCSLMEGKKGKKTNDAIKELTTFFNLPADLKPKVILHLFNPSSPCEDAKNPEVLAVFGYKRKQKQLYLQRGTRDEIFNNDSNFTQNKELRTNLYQLRNCKNENRFLASATEAFVNRWNNVVEASVTCVAPVIKRVFSHINMEDYNSSLVESDINVPADNSREIPKDAIPIFRFKEIFAKFRQIQRLYLQDIGKLNNFYTQQRLGNIKFERGERIPKSIEGLAFLHFFYKVNNEFLSKFAQYQKKNYSEFLQFIFSHIKQLSELIATINDTLLKQDSLVSVSCQNLERYVSFIKFLLHSTVNIRNITQRQLRVTGQIRVFFEQLKPKDNRILTFIIKNQEKIWENEDVNYYKLYLKIIRECCGKENQGKIESIYIMIHLYKANKIASKFSYDKRSVVEAIRSYCEILLRYDRLSESKKEKLNKFKIEKKIAKLLCMIGQAEEAVGIFKMNRLIVHLDQCVKEIVTKLSAEAAALKYIEFGEFFVAEFEYNLALLYFRKAYDIADTTETRRSAIQKKFWCIDQSNETRLSDRLPYSKFVAGGSEDDFVSGGENKDTSEELYTRLRNRLCWDQQSCSSTILPQGVNSESFL